MTNNIINGICFFCKTNQNLEQKPMFNDGKLCQEGFVCPSCNASNSKYRLTKEIEEDKAKQIQ